MNEPCCTAYMYLQTERCRTTDGLVDEMFTSLFSNEDNEEKRAQVLDQKWLANKELNTFDKINCMLEICIPPQKCSKGVISKLLLSFFQHHYHIAQDTVDP